MNEEARPAQPHLPARRQAACANLAEGHRTQSPVPESPALE